MVNMATPSVRPNSERVGLWMKKVEKINRIQKSPGGVRKSIRRPNQTPKLIMSALEADFFIGSQQVTAADITYHAMVTAYPFVGCLQLTVAGIAFSKAGIRFFCYHSLSTRSIGIHDYPPASSQVYFISKYSTIFMPAHFARPHHINILIILVLY